MRIKILFLALIVILSLPIVSAQTLACQYTTQTQREIYAQKLFNKENNEVIFVKNITDNYITKTPIRFGDFYIRNDHTGFTIYNSYITPIKLDISYYWNNRVGNKAGHVFDVPAGGSVVTDEWESIGSSPRINQESIEYTILENDFTYLKTEKEIITTDNCKTCLDKNCLNDGATCTIGTECGGGFCIENICNNKNEFFPGFTCKTDEVSCNNNLCVKKKSVEIGFKPICSEQECIYGAIDANGLCIETQTILEARTKLQMDKDNKIFFDNLQFLIIALVIIIVISIIGYHSIEYSKRKNLIEKQKLISAEIQKQKYEIEKMDDEISILREKNNKKESELKKLDDLKAKFEIKTYKLANYMSSEWERVNKPFPYELVGNRLVIVNPYWGGYYYFYKEGLDLKDYDKKTSVHRWIWKNAHGRWPKVGYDIHHIDGNKYNNDPSNLKEIERTEHLNLHKKKSY
ncbi:MAG: HNH endonuclease signature motif containing protein [Candidatus Diapherotrites archaeon]|nr:HNH endonuclease signature motif containing protein [Candidatus Diapherotrites archaeon]